MTGQEDLLEVMAAAFDTFDVVEPNLLARAALAALDRDGYVVVPKVPTVAMLEEGFGFCEGETAIDGSENCRKAWAAMLSAYKGEPVKKSAGIHHEREPYVPREDM